MRIKSNSALLFTVIMILRAIASLDPGYSPNPKTERYTVGLKRKRKGKWKSKHQLPKRLFKQEASLVISVRKLKKKMCKPIE